MPERKAMTITPKTRQKPSVSQTILRTHDEAVRSALDSVKSMDVRELRNPTAPGSSDVIYDGANFGPATPRVRALIDIHRTALARVCAASAKANDRDLTPEEEADCEATQQAATMAALNILADTDRTQADRDAIVLYANEAGEDYQALQCLTFFDLQLFQEAYKQYLAENGDSPETKASARDAINLRAGNQKETLAAMIEDHKKAEVDYDVAEANLENHEAENGTENAEYERLLGELQRTSEAVLDALAPLHRWKCASWVEALNKFEHLLKSRDMRRHLTDLEGTAMEFLRSIQVPRIAHDNAPTANGHPHQTTPGIIAEITAEYRVASALQDNLEDTRDILASDKIYGKLDAELSAAEDRVRAAILALVNFRPQTIEEVSERMTFIVNDIGVEDLFAWRDGEFGEMLLKSMVA